MPNKQRETIKRPLLATKRLEIVVEGDNATKGQDVERNARVTMIKGYPFWGSSADYAERLTFAAKCAVQEQGWELTDKPLYMAIVLHKGLPKYRQKGDPNKTIRKWRQTLMTEAAPSTFNLLRSHMVLLKGIVFKDYRQLVSTFTLKLYDNDSRTEIIFGQPETVRELMNDIRNL